MIFHNEGGFYILRKKLRGFFVICNSNITSRSLNIQQFWIQEINSNIYAITEQRNMIVNQVPKHQFQSKWGIM